METSSYLYGVKKSIYELSRNNINPVKRDP
jgi:hypothetical protein